MSKYPGCLICNTQTISMNPQALREMQEWHEAGHPKTQVSVSDMKPSDPEDKLKVISESSTGGTEEDAEDAIDQILREFRQHEHHGLMSDTPHELDFPQTKAAIQQLLEDKFQEGYDRGHRDAL